MNSNLATASVLALILVCLAASIHPVAAENQPVDRPVAAFSVGLEIQPEEEGQAPPPPALIGATYEIDVYSGMATGVLVQEFEHQSEEDQTAIYECSIEGAVDFAFLELGSYGRSRELPVEMVEQDATKAKEGRGAQSKRSTPRKAAKDGTSRARTLRSDLFDILPEERPTLRTGFRLALPVEGRLFKLALPTVRDTHSTKQPPAPVPVRILLTVHHEEPLPLVRSSTHQILVDFAGDRTMIETIETAVPGDRPFELEFALNDRGSPTIAGYIRNGEDGRRAVETVLTPPEAPGEQAARPKQLLFIIDSSGSMAQEEKMEQARRAVSSCVEKLQPQDRFNIVEFDSNFTLMAPEPVEPTRFGKDNTDQWLAQLTADGNTNLLPALEATLKQPHDSERHRMIVVVTDGNLADEKEVLKLLEAGLGEGRLFVVGTGRMIRQQTILRLAEYGRGAATFASDSNSLGTAVVELFDSISQPIGWDVSLDWDNAEVEEILPSRLPDLYADRPVRVLAWFSGDLPSALRLKMSTMEGERLFTVKMPPAVGLNR